MNKYLAQFCPTASEIDFPSKIDLIYIYFQIPVPPWCVPHPSIKDIIHLSLLLSLQYASQVAGLSVFNGESMPVRL
jgi:hypothetical protein